MNEEYNGHKNYATWLVSLWANNEKTQYDLWRGIVKNQAEIGRTKDDAINALTESLEEYFERETADAVEVLERQKITPALIDYLRSMISEVEFYDIAKDFAEDYDDLLKN